jgi:hypothetical protein
MAEHDDRLPAAARQVEEALARYDALEGSLRCDSGGGESEGNRCPEIETEGGECVWCELWRGWAALRAALGMHPPDTHEAQRHG